MFTSSLENHSETSGSVAVTTPASYSSLCPPDINLKCTEWIVDGFDLLQVNHLRGRVISTGQNSTEIKLCEYIDKMGDNTSNYSYPPVNQWVKSAGLKFPSGIALLKCSGAVFLNGVLQCGQPRPTSGAGHDFDALFGSDTEWPHLFQHNVQNGLGFAGVMWSLLKDVPDIHILTGPFLVDFYSSLVGRDHVHRFVNREWFRNVYLGTVPLKISPRHNQLPIETVQLAEGMQYGGDSGSDPMLPCSVFSMPGFQEWRNNISSHFIQHYSADGILLYLQREGKRSFHFWDCGDQVQINDTCSCRSELESEFIQHCRSAPESEFVDRLRALSLRHGLEMKVFAHTSEKKDAEIFARARVVLGPHGGSFANMIFLNPELNPIIIESNLEQASFDGCNTGRWKQGPRHFFSHLSASLGHRHVVHQPNVWKSYGPRASIKQPEIVIQQEINSYLRFIERTISGADQLWQESNEMDMPTHDGCRDPFKNTTAAHGNR